MVFKTMLLCQLPQHLFHRHAGGIPIFWRHGVQAINTSNQLIPLLHHVLFLKTVEAHLLEDFRYKSIYSILEDVFHIHLQRQHVIPVRHNDAVDLGEHRIGGGRIIYLWGHGPHSILLPLLHLFLPYHTDSKTLLFHIADVGEENIRASCDGAFC